MSPAQENDGVQLIEDLRRLEEIVRRLEAEEPDLDSALALFEEGVARLRDARSRLARAELTVQKVLEEADGTLRMEDLGE
jgi:exodeoxyribonuclease VII small subunit